MKTLDTAKKTYVKRVIFFLATPLCMAALYMEFIIYRILARIPIYIHRCRLVFTNTNAQKGVIAKFIHNRKHSLFTVIPDDAVATSSGKGKLHSS